MDYIELHRNWVKSDYDSDLKPSIDRINHKKRYSLNNIQVMTWRENFEKGIAESDSSVKRKKVEQLTLKGVYIKTFASIKTAQKSLKLMKADTGISQVCNGRRKSCGGFKWKFSDE